LIRAVAELGKASKELEEFADELEAIVSRSGAKHVFVLKIRIAENQATYEGLELEENKGEGKYLYRQDPTGTPGCFITGRIPMTGDVGTRMLQRSLAVLASKEASAESRERAKKTIADFEEKKIVGVTRGKWVRQAKDEVLNLLRGAILSNSGTIMKDICRKIEVTEPAELLLTVKIIEGSQEKYLGDIPSFREQFKAAATVVRTERIKVSAKLLLQAKCVVCNKEAVSGEFQNPLPFTFLDKPGFVPNGDLGESYKVFPLCSGCFLDLLRGQKFIEKYLNFSITSIEGERAEVKFWLVPVLNKPELLMSLLKDLSKSGTRVEGKEISHFLYLRNLKDMCGTMGAITTLALDSGLEDAEAYLTFTALFYTKDRQGHMRLISRSVGIYPKQLRLIAELKWKVDSLYPFKKVGVRFGFPLLREFLIAPNSEGWYKDLASILGDIFTGESLNKPLLYKAVAKKIQDRAREATDLKTIADISFKALNLIEYIERLELSETEEKHLVSSQGVQEAEKARSILQVKNFLDAHSRLLKEGTLRAVCATGIATGILLEVQRRERGSMSFWGRLNRLEMDLERVKQLFPQIVNKLHEYGFHAYDDVLAYLGSREVSNLDLGQKDLSKDLISLAFAVGMSQGYWIVHEKGV